MPFGNTFSQNCKNKSTYGGNLYNSKDALFALIKCHDLPPKWRVGEGWVLLEVNELRNAGRKRAGTLSFYGKLRNHHWKNLETFLVFIEECTEKAGVRT